MASRNEKGATAAGMMLSKPIDDRVKNHIAAPLIATEAIAAPIDHRHARSVNSSNGRPEKSRIFISHNPSNPNIINGIDEPK
jgi:hypothetical protein